MSLKSFGVDELYYFSRIENIKSIATEGIRCKNYVQKKNRYASFADEDVQERRSNKTLRTRGGKVRRVHDCVPLYMTSKTPAQYKVHEQEDSFFFLVLDSDIILNKDVDFSFTDGNAACANTNFYSSLKDLEKLPYEAIKAKWWNEHTDGKRKKCSEVLIDNRIDFSLVKGIVVNNTRAYNEIKTILRRNNIDKPLSISQDLFFTKGRVEAERGRMERKTEFFSWV